MPKKLPNKNNNGFSMVEVLIAIAIFAILLIPIISGIIRSMNRTTDAKTLQYRNEFAENVMEYVKEDSLENILKGSYLDSVGSYVEGDSSKDVNVSADFYKESGKSIDIPLDYSALSYTEHTSDVTSGSGVDIEYYPYEEYWMSGNIKLGTKHETYAYKMKISNKYYAEKEASEAYINPNNLALGIVEDIDYNKIALINGTIANYDDTVTNAFLSKKLEILKEKNPTWYEVNIKQASTNKVILFGEDTGTRIITIKVSGKYSEGYKVSCSLDYRDNGGTEKMKEVSDALKAEDYHIEYTPYTFEYPKNTKLPNIYLMYNVCIYNGMFSPDDYIVIDTDDVEDDTEVNCFIVETAERYSTNLTTANSDLATKNNAMIENANKGLKNNSTLYNNNTLGALVSKREDVNVHIAATVGSKLQNINIYHNFDLKGDNTDKNKKSSKVFYDGVNQTNPLGSLSSAKYKPLYNNSVGGASDPSLEVKHFLPLNKATEESRGLYDVSIWIEKGDDPDNIDVTKSPIMSATKGGDES